MLLGNPGSPQSLPTFKNSPRWGRGPRRPEALNDGQAHHVSMLAASTLPELSCPPHWHLLRSLVLPGLGSVPCHRLLAGHCGPQSHFRATLVTISFQDRHSASVGPREPSVRPDPSLKEFLMSGWLGAGWVGLAAPQALTQKVGYTRPAQLSPLLPARKGQKCPPPSHSRALPGLGVLL